MLEITYLSSARANFDKQLKELIAFDVTFSRKVERIVEIICRDVRKNGDAAVLKYTRRFDGVDRKRVAALELSKKVLHGALARLDHTQRRALEQAAARIRRYHRQQLAKALTSVIEANGTTLGQRVNALDRVGLYVPGGEAAYPSSVLMNAIPAKIAGVGELVMTVPTPGGVRNPLVLAAAAVAGVDRVFTIGGAQAIAALAYGTRTIRQVDKIVGPGNAYVTAAKRRVFGTVGIDMISGPTEIVVICDGTTDPDWIAMDLFSQAEHSETAQAILISPSEAFIERVEKSIRRQLPNMSRRKIIERSLRKRGALIKVRSLNEACDIANRIAPEHLELSLADPKKWLGKIRHAGAIFLGPYSSEALGDYCAGPNHVLPTGRTARFSSPLGVYDFQKRSSILGISIATAAALGPVAVTLARGEGLPAHAQSALYRVSGN